jgi:hypothetical protein
VPGSGGRDDLAAARAITAALASSGLADLDAWLSPAQRAEVLAWGALTAQALDAATQFTTWCEARGFREFRKVRARGGG